MAPRLEGAGGRKTRVSAVLDFSPLSEIFTHPGHLKGASTPDFHPQIHTCSTAHYYNIMFP
jgi:hypothetical protein